MLTLNTKLTSRHDTSIWKKKILPFVVVDVVVAVSADKFIEFSDKAFLEGFNKLFLLYTFSKAISRVLLFWNSIFLFLEI